MKKYFLLAILLISSTAYGQKSPIPVSGGLADPGSNGVIKRTAENVTAPATATDVSTPSQCADAGANDTYACNLAPALASYIVGTKLRFFANTANTAGASINFNAVGALTIVKMAGGITTALATGDINAGQWVEGTIAAGSNFQMTSQVGGSAGITNSAGENVIPKADAGGNLVASIITEDPSGDFISVAGTPLYARTLGDGELLIGATGGAPIAAPLTALPGGSIQIVNGPGTIEIGLAPLSEGDQRFIFSDVEGHLSVSSSPANVDGAILIGGSTGEPTATTLTEGTGVVITNGPGSIVIATAFYKSGTPAIAGNGTLNTGSKDSAGKVTTTGTGASTIVLTFASAFARAPACMVTNETTANLVRPISTTTTLTVAATIVSGDSLAYTCTGY